jgi:hypothetical protein
MVRSNLASCKFCSFSYCGNDVTNYRIGAPCFPRKLVCILMSDESVRNL